MAQNTKTTTTTAKRQARRKSATKKAAPKLPLTTREKLADWLHKPLAGKLFLAASGFVLLCTTLVWTVLSATLQGANADQLVDSYLFENSQTFANATFPGAHSFLLKWPVFAVMQLFGTGLNMFMATTTLIVLGTVGSLVYLLHRIEKRPYMLGILCLALASVLLLIPAQPYAGALLPVNMAMTTTRNLEYIVFLVVLWFASRVPKLESWPAIGTGLILTVLIASDKLFAVLAFGSCLFAALWYGIVLRKKSEMLRALGWLLVVIVSIGAATVSLLGLTGLHITNVSNGDAASPYVLLTSFKQIAVAILFGTGALLTNFGANPVHSVTVLRDVPGALGRRLADPSIAAYAVNFGLFVLGIYATVRLLLKRRWTAAELEGRDLKWYRLSLLLVGATVVAAAVYVLTVHYYPVDARYLTIALFAVTIAAATYWSSRRVDLRVLGVLALVIVATIPFGMSHAVQEYTASQRAMSPRNHMTARVSEELDRRDVKRLIGNYWDVTPVKAAMAKPVTVAPVDNCTVPRDILTSRAWYKLPQNTPTAYLAVRDGSAEAGPDSSTPNQASKTATYGGCSIQRLVGTYGVPTERVRIDAPNPQNGGVDVLLLVYPDGTKTAEQAAKERKAAEKPEPPVHKSLTPLSALANCDSGVSLQVVAHEDDDILFMNPDLLMSIKAGRCIRTVYVTAGNAGEGVNYWGGRELGAKAAYATMFDVANVWHDEQQYIGDNKVTVSYLEAAPKVSLVFLRLPDGNLHGEGFAGDGYTSLHGLLDGSLPQLAAVDQSSTYTKQQLVDTLLGVMTTDQVDEIRTQGSDNQADGDHADHHDVGILTTQAAAAYTTDHTVTHYLGYPDRKLAVNLSDDVISLKQTIFLAYAKFDGAVCQTLFECQQTPTYGSYLTRQYQPQP